ncbi:proteasome subunit beta type-6-like [Miscanthus floridulus]|uniref:proteasome subunit beta type-6-like n=1 Tax=Miscanthus floridulus TaxID=154761 RepID=UPI00345934FF
MYVISSTKSCSLLPSSGSSYLYALLDHEWKEGMSQEEAEKFVVKVVSLAMARDGASGGVVRTVTCKFLKVSESWINNRYLLVSPRTRNRLSVF